jgi:hypothetical protein
MYYIGLLNKSWYTFQTNIFDVLVSIWLVVELNIKYYS